MRGYLAALSVAIAAGCGPAGPEAVIYTRDEFIEGLTASVAEVDQNRDRRIDKAEWQKMVRRDFPETAEDVRQRWGNRDFAVSDTDGDGFLAEEELLALSLVGFDCLDTDDDHRFSWRELDAAGEATCLPSRTVTE